MNAAQKHLMAYARKEIPQAGKITPDPAVEGGALVNFGAHGDVAVYTFGDVDRLARQIAAEDAELAR